MPKRNYVPTFGEASRAACTAGNAPQMNPSDSREEFLRAVEEGQFCLASALKMHVAGCRDILPRSACGMLDLAPGSTYADAAAAL